MKLLKKNFVLTIKEFYRLSYFCKKGNYIIHNSGYKHQVFEEKNIERITLPRLLSIGMGQMSYGHFYFFYEDWLNNEGVKKKDIFLWNNIEKIEVELDKKELFFKKLVNLENNFPRKIVFITTKKEIFSIMFKENGLLERIINNSEEKLIIKKMEKDFWVNFFVPK